MRKLPARLRPENPILGSRRAFTLVELLVSMAILSLILVMLLSMVNSVSTLWRRTTGKVSVFQEARAGFEAMTRKISQATLNTYWDYINTGGVTRTEYFKNSPSASASSFEADEYARASELHFIAGQADQLLAPVPGLKTTTHAVFFQAPLGYSDPASSSDVELQKLLNTKGFFIQIADDSTDRPNFLNGPPPLVPSTERHMLMELWQPTEELSIYDTPGNDWFVKPIKDTPAIARPLAENIVALIVWPQRARQDPGAPITDDYGYDTRAYAKTPPGANADLSRNQLPPLLQVTMVAIDNVSGARLAEMPTSQKTKLEPGALFTTLPGAALAMQEAKFQSDLDELEKFLQDNRLDYRVFTSSVPIKQAKWSNDQ